ncbi:Uncharacterized protein LCER1_G004036 [Lachnellula cervina]|uniref:RBR-type E3 ubiquitin transferase n=1 Tax=Lachnellula cervina TaxID=1316786 RepID=A0A7D8YP59_9HELO|nr:Uncharacterized protein LCER1_G004036 [Lachnellula cervina]
MEGLPLLGTKYETSARLADPNNERKTPFRPRFFLVESVVGSSSDQDGFLNVDTALEKAHSNHLKALEENPFQLRPKKILHNNGSKDQLAIDQQHATVESVPTTCLACTEDFSEDILRVYLSELDSKGCGKIKCPECNCLLAYEDIQRLADPATFVRYETLTLRNALSTDEQFVWCQNCESGHIHYGGASHPLIHCPDCGFKSCFTHKAPWHHRYTCGEYDEMLKDPDGFRDALEKKEHGAERERIQQEVQDMQEKKMKKARANDEMEAVAKRKDLEERARQMELLKQRQQEDELSLAKVQATTKRCPDQGCNSPIEKHRGCQHMTCSACKHQFCWACMRNWSGHGTECLPV